MNLSAAKAAFEVEWIDPAQNVAVKTAYVQGGAKQKFQSPFDGDAVLRLYVA